MTNEPPADGTAADDAGFDQAQQASMAEIGQALVAQSLPGTVALELVVTQTAAGQSVNLDFQLNLERQSGLTLPVTAEDALVEAVQRLVLLWREHDREPWHTFTYRLTRGESGPRFESAFDY